MNASTWDAGSFGNLNPTKEIFYGTLDTTDGVVFFGLHGMNPIQVLQYIASGLLGERAFHGGLAAARGGHNPGSSPCNAFATKECS